ncbi:MAG TPA: AraC family transcriptional regulator [Puia sp.]|nr:AraC family transcriptional regulator [Puia sp.]
MMVSELLFVEYTCMAEETRFGFWSDRNYFAFIASGKKAWRTVYQTYEVDGGDILFVKKGANLAHQFFEEEFCAIFIFIPDDFIRAFLRKHSELANGRGRDIAGQDAVLRVEPDVLLKSYYQSIQSYLSLPEKPHEELLLLKFEELLLSLFHHEKHRELTDYFLSLTRDGEFHMKRVMEANFAYNLQLKDYARLCHMSLTTFKKAFGQHYGIPPAAWLKSRRLELAHQKLLGTDLPIQEISLECGFEDVSHFIRVFKSRYGLTPLQYRQQHSRTTVTGV